MQKSGGEPCSSTTPSSLTRSKFGDRGFYHVAYKYLHYIRRGSFELLPCASWYHKYEVFINSIILFHEFKVDHSPQRPFQSFYRAN
jgi:hypothetical protein